MKNIEKEYTFVIPVELVNTKPNIEIAGFRCVSNIKFDIEDVLFERLGKPLNEEKIGLRIRKQNEKIELTYKKFLERVGDMVKYDERNTELDLVNYKKLRNGELEESQYEIINNLKTLGTLYINMIIGNKRTVYRYEKEGESIDLMVEDLSFAKDGKFVADAMIEIEIVSSSETTSDIEDFVNEVKKQYKAISSEEGKNTRGARLLSQ